MIQMKKIQIIIVQNTEENYIKNQKEIKKKEKRKKQKNKKKVLYGMNQKMKKNHQFIKIMEKLGFVIKEDMNFIVMKIFLKQLK